MLGVGLLGLGVRQRTLEVVERGQQLGRDAAHAVARGLLHALSVLLAHVLELGRLAQREVLPVELGGLLGSLDGGVLGEGLLGLSGGGLTRRGLLHGGFLRSDVALLAHGLLALVHDLGIDDVLLGRAAVLAGAVGRGLGRRLLLGALVHGLGDLVERGLQGLGLGVDVV